MDEDKAKAVRTRNASLAVAFGTILESFDPSAMATRLAEVAQAAHDTAAKQELNRWDDYPLADHEADENDGDWLLDTRRSLEEQVEAYRRYKEEA